MGNVDAVMREEAHSGNGPNDRSGDDTQHVDVPFSVAFTHRLRQTHDVTADDFTVLESVLTIDQPSPPKVVCWVDSNLTSGDAHRPAFGERLWERLQQSAAVQVCGDLQAIPGGEAAKHSEAVLRELLDSIHHLNLDRRSVILVAGGGAVLDVAGFAAAIAHRGIRLVRLPSTTLAQADSGVGVKNAINYFQKKNWIGSFAVPWAVINDGTILDTLPDRDFRCGLTEAVKVSLIKDADLFAFLHQHAGALRRRDQERSKQAIARSCRLHLDHITLGGDPFESLQARPLDFGHWSAHRLEPMTRFALRHGEAVGIGVALDTLYSARKFGLPETAAMAVCQTLAELGTPLWCEGVADSDALLLGLEEFRQHLGGQLTVTMLQDVGRAIDVHEIDRDVMRDCIGQLRTIAGQLNATVELA